MEISTKIISHMRLSFETQFKIEIFTTVYWWYKMLRISVGKHIFSKTAHMIFLKLLMKLVCLKGKKLMELDFGEKISFWG